MKKTILTSFAALAVASSALAQGTVSWANITPTFMTAQTNNITYSGFVGSQAGQATGIAGAAQGGTSVTALGYYYQLLYILAPGGQTAAPTTLAGLNAYSASPNQTGVNNTGTAGRLTATGINTVQSSTPAGWDPSVKANIILVGWSANLGTTWSSVSAKLNDWANNYVADAYFGVSSSGWISPNNIGANGATLFGSAVNPNGNPINSPNTQLYLLSGAAPVPEPSTLALAGLGGLALLAFRRRK